MSPPLSCCSCSSPRVSHFSILQSSTNKPFDTTTGLIEVSVNHSFPYISNQETAWSSSFPFCLRIPLEYVFWKYFMMHTMNIPNSLCFWISPIYWTIDHNFGLINRFIILSLQDILAECRQKSICVINHFDKLDFLNSRYFNLEY